MEFVNKSTVSLVSASASDDTVCHAAWVSNFGGEHERKPNDIDWNVESARAWRKRTGGLIDFLYKNRHMSPFEHGHMTFFIETPIFVAREFMRHRTLSYNEMSGRYKELPPRFFVVDSQRPLRQVGKVGAYTFKLGTDEQYGHTFATTTQAYQNAWGAYQNMLNAGVAKEVARNVLPVGIMTQFYVTGNPRNWMQFLTLRNDEHALAEIRAVAEQIEYHFSQNMPLTYAAYKKYDLRGAHDEISHLRARLEQYEAYESYADNIR